VTEVFSYHFFGFSALSASSGFPQWGHLATLLLGCFLLLFHFIQFVSRRSPAIHPALSRGRS